MPLSPKLKSRDFAKIAGSAALGVSAATLALVAIASTTPVLAQATKQQVRIDSGVIEGAVSAMSSLLKGFHTPPVGNLRWRAPQRVTLWRDLRPATTHGLDCMQKPIPGDAAASGGRFGEDCLVLNVWHPATTQAGAALPVLVWIHGGGFLNGGS